MLKFLDDETLLCSVTKLIEDGERADLAVAYWGRGAIDKLGIQSTKPMRILCDLLSGGCNPREIKKFLEGPFADNKEFCVRYLNNLHAKVYATPTSIIVGSANASANGFGDGDRIGTLEAAVQTDDRAVVGEAAKWFDGLWKKSKKIDDAALEKARDAWRSSRSKRPPKATVLEVLANDPDWFRGGVWVTYYVSDVSDNAKARFEQIKERYYSPHQLERFEEEGLPIYDWPQKEASQSAIGDIFIDLTAGKIYELVELSDYSNWNCIALLKPKANVLGLPFPAKDRSNLKKAIEKHLGSKKEDLCCNLEELPEDVTEELTAHPR
jgi:hypothetical protein